VLNSWWEIKIICDSDLEDAIFWRLEKFGCRGMATEINQKNWPSIWTDAEEKGEKSEGHEETANEVVKNKEEQIIIRGYVSQIEVDVLDLAALALWLRQDALLLDKPTPVTRWSLIDEEDWSSSWKQHWQPQEIGDRFLIYPAWLEPPVNSERIILRLDPGAAFGTGVHPTTQLCMESLEMRLGYTESKSVIADIGCGSGILSIGALLLGATKVYGVDTDIYAVEASRSNGNLNGIDPKNLVIEKGSVAKLKELNPSGFDGILCNILAETILKLIPEITAMAKPNSWGVFSGILLEQTKLIADSLETHGWTVAALWKRQEWCCFNIRR